MDEKMENRRNMLTGLVIGLLFGLALGVAWGQIIPGALAGLGLGAGLGLVLNRRLPTMKMPAQRFRRILFALVVCVLLINTTLFLPDVIGEQWNGYILPFTIASGIWVVTAIARAIASLDEMQRRIQTEAIAIGFAILAVLAFSYGAAGILLDAPQFNWLAVVCLMTVSWLIGKAWTLRKYGE